MKNNAILLKSGTNEMELLTVRIGGQLFGMNVAKIQSIQQYRKEHVTALASAPPAILGMLLYRKRTIPLLDLASILGIPDDQQVVRKIVIVTEFNKVVNSFKVDAVERIYRISWAKFVPMNHILVHNQYVTGSVNIESNEILVLDLEHILAQLFPDLVLEDVTDDLLQAPQALARNKLKILFAEDSHTIRKMTVSVLTKAGFGEILEFENGRLVKEYIESNKEQVKSGNGLCVLVSDIEMPEMDGLTLCRHLKSNPASKTIRVVMFSSLINSQMIDKCKSVGADGYVTKPEANELIKILDGFCSANQ